MPDNAETRYYEILQISPEAEPEVVAAAYRALAKKYHPDRSSVPDAMNRMARLNVAYQSIRTKLATSGAGTKKDVLFDNLETFTAETINPNNSLEEITNAISRKLTTARERVIAEVQAQGLPKDVTVALVTKALRASLGMEQSLEQSDADAGSGHLDLDGSYDKAIRIVANKALRARDGLTDQLVKDGLQRNVAAELVDSAFEHLRNGGKERKAAANRLSPERVDLSASLERGMILVMGKMAAASSLVVQELMSDGVPQKTAEQLVHTAIQQMTKTGNNY